MEQKSSPDLDFDRLPEAELRHIIRQLSARPRGEEWQSEVYLRDALKLLQVGGPLAVCARREFLHLETWCPDGNVLKGALVAEGYRPSGKDLFEQLLSELAPTLQGLSIGCFINQLNISKILPQCVSIRYLQITDESDKCNFPDVLHACRGNLLELSITGTSLTRDRINAIAQYCPGVTKLTLHYERIDGSLREMWKAIGPTLTHLSIFNDAIIWGNVVDRIDEFAAQCVKVHWFQFYGRNEGPTPDLVRICEIFGAQLKLLKICTRSSSILPSSPHIFKILDSCPDLLVDVCVTKRDVERLSNFGDRVRALELDGEPDCDAEEIGKAVPNIEELILFVIETEKSGSFVSKWLSSPKPFLKVLHVKGTGWDLEEASNPLDIIAPLITTIEMLHVEAFRAVEPRAFRKFVETNKSLKKVRVWSNERGEDQAAEEIAAAGFVECFAQCPLLEELFLELQNELPLKSALIAEACVPLRGRSADIFICGTQYVKYNSN